MVMNVFRDKRQALLLVGGVVILVVAILAASLDGLEFKPAIPFSPAAETDGLQASPVPPPAIVFWYLVVIVIGILTLGTILALVFTPPKQRRRLILTLLMMVFLLIVAALFISRQGEAVEIPAEQISLATEAPAEVATPQPGEEVLPSEFVAPPVSPWLSFGVAFSIFAAVVFLLWLSWRARQTGGEARFEELVQIARQALDDLQSGKDYGDTVIECYARMTEAVRERRGLKRREHMTASEFAAALERARLPGEAVRRLTGLFEAVRYGGRPSTPQDVAEAMACLTAILDGFREAR
jgi:hypothetical protein